MINLPILIQSSLQKRFHYVLVTNIFCNGNQVFHLVRSSHDHNDSFFTGRRHVGPKMTLVDWPERTYPARLWVSQHQVEVEFVLFSQHAEFFKKDKIIHLFPYPKQTKPSLTIIVGHNWIQQGINSSDSWFVCYDANMPITFSRTPFPF